MLHPRKSRKTANQYGDVVGLKIVSTKAPQTNNPID